MTERRVGNPKHDRWARNLSEEFYRTSLGHNWLDRDGSDLKNTCQIIKTRRNDIKRQSNREKMKEKTFLASYWNTKQKRG
jgi:hypothetical protein